MKKKLKIKYIVMIIAGAGLVVGILFWKRTTNQEIVIENKPTVTGIVQPTEKPAISMAPIQETPEKIVWNSNWEIVKQKDFILKSEGVVIDDDRIKNWMAIFGIDKSETMVPIGETVYYNDKYGKITLSVDKTAKTLGYGYSLLGEEGVNVTKEKLTNEVLTAKSLDLLDKLFSIEAGWEYKLSQQEYINGGDSQFMASSQDEAAYIHYWFDLKRNGKTIRTTNGFMAETIFKRDGKLIQLRAVIPPMKTTEGAEVGLVTKEKAMTEKPTILTMVGRKGLNDFDSRMTMINITKAEVGYWYHPNEENMIPALLGEGTGLLPSGPVIVYLGLELID